MVAGSGRSQKGNENPNTASQHISLALATREHKVRERKTADFKGWLSLLFLFRVLCVLLRPSQKIEGGDEGLSKRKIEQY